MPKSSAEADRSFSWKWKPVAALLACGTAAAAPAIRAAEATPAPIRPDILLIMPDQMRGDCLSLLGHPAAKTPQLDQLVRDGVLFRRAYATVPSCIPARYALLTGQSPQASGIVGFFGKEIKTPTLPEMLGTAGYATVMVGRNMHQVQACGSCGYQRQILGSTYKGGDDYDAFLKKSAPKTKGILPLISTMKLDCNLWQAKPWPLTDNLHPTAWVVDQSRQVLAETPSAQPLFLTASFYAPHPPLFPPQRFFDAYLASPTLPKPAHGDWVNWTALSADGDGSGHRVLLEGETLRRAQAGYFGLIEQIDSEMAPLVAEFKARSEKAGRPWLVVFTSDHGEMLGDHGYFRKCEPYEGAANIPMVVAGSPNLGLKAGARCDRPVCLEDLMPTLLGLANVPCPKSVDGVDLRPALHGEPQEVRAWLHLEHSPCYSKAQAFQALTDGHVKYIWRPQGGTEQLFNLDLDPREEHDLSKDPAEQAALQQWRQLLVKRLAGRPEKLSDGTRLLPYR